ncbi:hypothetical protein JKP75_00515 [Blastococcus sp. TML/M2B]|uniref:hypothetical protein n=1 Tax=unclassified Blastococcus TaxID=2619396 RepID=UPI00190DDFF7|nr:MULTISPECIES: hypothetical protein [unclassified Blastococcus]MBN1091207.1 hypothetical protein [Blastococcus sp. TML/M2B]MBN1095239.1 hypothetical protein [Blastococcus sp. TML/C7B]
MGLFDRRAAPPDDGTAPAIGAAELADATALMDRWDAALGSSDAIWATLAQIADRGATPPWPWWAAASRAAAEAGDPVLVGRIFLFTHLVATQLAPRMTPEKEREVGLGRPDPLSYRAVAELAMRTLPQLPQEQLLHDTATGKVDAAAAWTMAAAVAAS